MYICIRINNEPGAATPQKLEIMKTTILNTNGEKVTLTGNFRDLGHGRQLEVIYSDGSKGYEHYEDLEDDQVIIEIKETQLREILNEAFKEAFQFGWTGWRIPIFVENNGEVLKGSWMSQNSYQPDALELPVRIEAWDLDFENPTEEDIDYEIEERVDFVLRQLNESPQDLYGVSFVID